MKTSKTQVLLDKHGWLRTIINGTPWYFKAVLRYIVFASLEPGDEARLTPRNYTFTVEHSWEQIRHSTWVHVFYHLASEKKPGHAAEQLYRLSDGQTLADALGYLRESGKVVDAIVIQTKVHSSKIGDLTDSYDVVIPAESTIDHDKKPRLISEGKTVAEVGIHEIAYVRADAIRDKGTTINPEAPTAKQWTWNSFNTEVKRFDDKWFEVDRPRVGRPRTVYLRA